LRILDKEKAETFCLSGLCIIGGLVTGAFSGTTASGFTVCGVTFGVTAAGVSSFFATGVLTSVIEKVGFL
jgi:hypothetical protein